MLNDRLYINGYRLTLIEVVYYLPDYPSLLNEFWWQTLDLPPNFQRTHKFLNHWYHNIEAVIKEVKVAYQSDPRNDRFRTVDHLSTLRPN